MQLARTGFLTPVTHQGRGRAHPGKDGAIGPSVASSPSSINTPRQNRRSSDGFWQKVLELHLVVMAKRPHKAAWGKAEAVVMKLGERDHVPYRRSRLPVVHRVARSTLAATKKCGGAGAPPSLDPTTDGPSWTTDTNPRRQQLSPASWRKKKSGSAVVCSRVCARQEGKESKGENNGRK
jgi:hypothetical protein